MRKIYEEVHTSGLGVQIAAEAEAYAARTPGTRVELHDGLAVTISGDAHPDHVAAFLARARAAGEGEVFQGRQAA